MSNFFHTSILLFLILFTGLNSVAQKPFISEKSLDVNMDYVVETWNSENALPQNTVMRIFQAHNGFLWIATFNGLMRYDGKLFKLFNTLNTPGITNNSVKYIIEDKNNVLWFSTVNGKLIKYQDENFETITINNDENISVKHICKNEKGILLVLTEKNEIYKYNGELFSLVIKFPVNSLTFLKIHYDLPDSSLCVGTNNGLYKYKNNRFSLVPEVKGKILLIRESRDNHIWIYADSILYTSKNNIYSPYKLPEELKKQGPVTDFYVDRNDDLLITTKSGLTHLENQSSFFYNTKNGLPSNNLSIV
jgi:ligand-binding sensor domain-containing protein